MSSKKGVVIISCAASVCLTVAATVVIFALEASDVKLWSSGASSVHLNSFYTFSAVEPNASDSSPVNDEEDQPPANAVGKVVKAFLSPYVAKCQYKNIYLNNRTDYELNMEEIYLKPPGIKILKCKEPEVLILHTHATEGYLAEDKTSYTQEDIEQTRDAARSVISVGEIICETLDRFGITAIQDKTLHDDPSYTNSYNRSAETIASYMEKYPSIKIVIDIHRDSVSTDGGLVGGVSEQNGKNAAQIMFVTGSQTGKVTGFENWQENLRLVMRLQEISETLYPGLARAIYFTSKKYNQHLSTGSLLIEVGTSVNTVDEAKYSAELLGKILGIGLNLYAEEE